MRETFSVYQYAVRKDLKPRSPYLVEIPENEGALLPSPL
jgi:hypothetical protein